MPQTDTYKLLASLITAVLLVVVGIALIVFIYLQPTDPNDPSAKAGIMSLLSGFVGFGINYLFQTNTAAAARAQTRNDLLTNSTPGTEDNP